MREGRGERPWAIWHRSGVSGGVRKCLLSRHLPRAGTTHIVGSDWDRKQGRGTWNGGSRLLEEFWLIWG